jgi:hypothetical protein
MRILVYAHHNEKEAYDYMLSLRNGEDQSAMRAGQHWHGEIEKCDKIVYTAQYEKIGTAYIKAGKLAELFGESVPKIVEKPQEPIAENIGVVIEEVIESNNVKVDGRTKAAKIRK